MYWSWLYSLVYISIKLTDATSKTGFDRYVIETNKGSIVVRVKSPHGELTVDQEHKEQRPLGSKTQEGEEEKEGLTQNLKGKQTIVENYISDLDEYNPDGNSLDDEIPDFVGKITIPDENNPDHVGIGSISGPDDIIYDEYNPDRSSLDDEEPDFIGKITIPDEDNPDHIGIGSISGPDDVIYSHEPSPDDKITVSGSGPDDIIYFNRSSPDDQDNNRNY